MNDERQDKKNYDEIIIDGQDDFVEDKDIWKIRTEWRFREDECIEKVENLCEQKLQTQLKEEFKNLGLKETDWMDKNVVYIDQLGRL